MSIIGPRPLLVSYLPWYTEEEKQRHMLLIVQFDFIVPEGMMIAFEDEIKTMGGCIYKEIVGIKKNPKIIIMLVKKKINRKVNKRVKRKKAGKIRI